MRPSIISIMNRKGGVGKTTLAIALADTFVSEFEQHTALVDLDPQSSASHALLNDLDFLARTEAGVTLHQLFRDRLASRQSDEDIYRAGMVHRISDRSHVNCDLYPNSEKFWDLESEQQAEDSGTLLKSEIGQFLNELKAVGRVVVVDCPPGQSVSSLGAIEVSDLVLCPITPDRFALWGKDQLSGYIERNCSGKVPKFVVSKARMNGGADVLQSIELLAQQKQMLKVETGSAEAGVFGHLAPFSDRANVRNRIQLDRNRSLDQIYGSSGAHELRNIAKAIVREIGKEDG